MTPEQVKQQKKATALNEIRKIYHPLYDGYRNNSWSESYVEQRDEKVRRIIEELEKELNNKQ